MTKLVGMKKMVMLCLQIQRLEGMDDQKGMYIGMKRQTGGEVSG